MDDTVELRDGTLLVGEAARKYREAIDIAIYEYTLVMHPPHPSWKIAVVDEAE